MTDRRIAVVGMAFRLPGADDELTLWRNIRDGVCSVQRFTDEQLAAAGVPPEEYREADFIGASALIPGIAEFDAAFFGMSGNTARATDPQQRLFLEVAYHALEDAGYAAVPDGVRVGVFAGHGYHLYGHRTYLVGNLIPEGWPDWVSGSLVTYGNHPDFIATRASFALDLTGPAMGVQSACSTGLTTVHIAGQSLLTGDTDIAVAGAAAVHVPQVLGFRHVRGSILSRTGVCRAFDAEADGTVGGNGVVAVILKRLDDALADGDTIHAVLLGSGIGNDGASKAGYSAPSAEGQRRTIRRALEAAGVSAESIGYLESHGTGTFKGDPIEFEGLTAAFREDTDRVGYCALGSTKANIGHLDACAGLASLVKTILVLKNRTIPPMANFRSPNPLLPLTSSPFDIPAQARPWPAGDSPRRAGINALGVGGTNVHLVVEEAPERHRPGATLPPLPLTPVPLSAKSPQALVELRDSYVGHLRSDVGAQAQDVTLSAAAGRPHYAHRTLVLGRDLGEVADRLEKADAAAHAAAPLGERGVAFVFSGQGSACRGMARALWDLFPIVRGTLEDCDRHHRELTGESLLPALLETGGAAARDDAADVWPTELAQPALFAHQVALCRLWESLGVRPRLVAGHSVGEYAALYAAGALTVAEGMRLTVGRGRLMRDASVEAGMVAVFAERADVDELLASVPDLDLAAVNGRADHVLAGPVRAVRVLGELLDARGVAYAPLAVDRAFHSRLLDPMLEAWRGHAAGASLTELDIPFVTGPDGVVREPGWRPDADYLVRQTRRPVRFDLVLAGLADSGVGAVVEIGAGTTLTGLARRALPEEESPLLLPTQRRGRAAETLLASVGALYCAGADIDWNALTEGRGGGRVPLPRYPYQHRTYWTGPLPDPSVIEPRPATHSEGNRGNSMSSTSAATTHEQQVLARIVDLTVRHFGCDPSAVRPGSTFVEFGADSLQMINMVRELEKEYSVRVGLREVFEEAGSPALLAAMVAKRSGDTAKAADPVPVPSPAPALAPAVPAVPAFPAAPAAGNPAVPAAPVAPVIPAYAPAATAPATPSLEALAEQVRVLQQVQLQMMEQLSQLVSLQLAGARGDR
ncbi:type I polyketide synthase [Streptacidiphilus melanogenes]|uniref:type I polyketide synthase n=1 Tax=Streptacidiphilus melanogenes TaxID=411235 RepID=UPI0005A6EE30|nr:type I polyketide synthase [Streptacidiphilus melanogenes]